MKRRGLALIVVLGVLAVLAVLAAAFATMARLERRASAQRVYAAKAELLARSGLEDALARLGAGQDPEAAANAYGGEDWNGNGVLDAGTERASEVFRKAALDTGGCPVRHALRPSFWVRDPASGGLPARVTAEGRERGFSGRLPVDAITATYALKAAGECGLYVNGGDLGSAGEHAGTYDTVLKRVLGTLAEEIGQPRAAGEDLVQARPAGGWTSLDQVRGILGWTAERAEAFEPYLAFQAWVDRKVIRSNLVGGGAAGWALMAGEDFRSWAQLRTGYRPAGESLPLLAGRRFNPHAGSYAPDFERARGEDLDGDGVLDLGEDANANGRLDQAVLGRAPVDLNWALSRPAALRALLRDLEGLDLDPTTGSNSAMDKTTNAVTVPSRVVRARAVALDATDVTECVSALALHTGFPTWASEFPDWDGTARFDSWDEFNRFLDLKVPFAATAVTSMRDAKRDLVKAAFNPNACSNKLNPGRSAAKRVDKADVCVYSTEFCFRTPGVWRIEAAGRLTDARGRLLAERTVRLGARTEQVRITAQSEFAAGDGGLGRLDEAGDESAFRNPAADPGFLAAGYGTADNPTWGAGALGHHGTALQTFPEPLSPATSASGEAPAPAAWDGGLQLATLETPPGELYGAATGTSGMMLLLTWNTGMEPAVRGATDPWVYPSLPDSNHDTNPSGSEYTRGASVMGSRRNSSRVNGLLPDGCYSEGGLTPAYPRKGGLPSNRAGCLSFWAKPNYQFTATTNLLGLERGHTLVNLTQKREDLMGAGTIDQMFFVANTPVRGYGGMPGDDQWATFWEREFTDTVDGGVEYGIGTTALPERAHQWYLLTLQWNFDAPDLAGQYEFRVDLSRAATEYSTLSPAGPSEDLTSNPDGLSDYVMIGRRAPLSQSYLGKSTGQSIVEDADCTFDEFAVYDLSTDMANCALMAQARYAKGRYNKENEAADALSPGTPDPDRPQWRSALLELGAGARILRLDWTLVLPRYDPADPLDPNRMFYGRGSALSGGVPVVVPGATADARIQVLDADAAATPLLAASRPGVAGVRLPSGRCRLGASLRPQLQDNANYALFGTRDWTKGNAPLLESPLLDDITVTYVPGGAPRITAWREGG